MPDDSVTTRLTLSASDGVRLEAEATIPSGVDLRGAVVLAHPHPLQGGSMASLVTSELFRTLPDEGLAVLRFNFRGVGASTGTHEHGVGERLDIEAAIDALAELTPARPLVLCGWSFGADVSLTVVDARLAGWVLIAPPLRFLSSTSSNPSGTELGAPARVHPHQFGYEEVGRDPRPKLLIVPEHDEFRSPASAAAETADWTATTVETVLGADHFLVGRTHVATRLVSAFTGSIA